VDIDILIDRYFPVFVKKLYYVERNADILAS